MLLENVRQVHLFSARKHVTKWDNQCLVPNNGMIPAEADQSLCFLSPEDLPHIQTAVCPGGITQGIGDLLTNLSSIIN